MGIVEADSTAEKHPPRQARPELDRLRHVARDVVLFRLLFLGVGWLARWMTTQENARPNFALDHWMQWDSHHFLAIADVGYADSVADGNSAGFYPGFPFAVRVMATVTGTGYLVAGLIVSFVATLIAAYYLHRLAEHHGYSGDRAVLALLLFPTAVFLVAPYTEALFLAAAIPAFYYAKQDRPWAVVPCVFVATLARAVGPFVALGAIIELLRQRGKLRDLPRLGAIAAVGFAGALPALGHGLYLREREGTIFAYAKAQNRITARGLSNPVDGFVTTTNTWWSGASANNVVTFQLELVFVALSLGLLVWLVLRREWGYVGFVGATLLVSVAAPYWLSIPRFALTFFPFALVVAERTKDRDLERRLLPILGGLSMIGVFVYVNGFWYF